MDFTDALSGLRDIHMPGDISAWPPAPGWWILAALPLGLLGWSLVRTLRQRHQLKRYRSAVEALDQLLLRLQASRSGDEMEQRLVYVNEVNSILRRVALLHFDHDQVASLSGTAWTDFLRQHDQRAAITPQLAEALAHGRFARRCDIEPTALDAMARHWIKDLYMARIKPDLSATSKAADHHA